MSFSFVNEVGNVDIRCFKIKCENKTRILTGIPPQFRSGFPVPYHPRAPEVYKRKSSRPGCLGFQDEPQLKRERDTILSICNLIGFFKINKYLAKQNV